MQFTFRADVDTLRRFVEQEQHRLSLEPFAVDDLLLVAAAEGRHRGVDVLDGADVQSFEPAGDHLCLGPPPQERETPHVFQAGDADVLARGQVHEAAGELALGRDVGDPAGDGHVRTHGRQQLPAQLHPALVVRPCTKHGGAQSFASGTGDAGDTQDLARPYLEVQPAQCFGMQVGHPEHGRELRVGLLEGVVGLLELVTEQVPQQTLPGQAGDRLGGHPAPVAQHGGPLGDVEHLVEAVRDVEDADVAGGHCADDRHQLLHLLLGQPGGGLVEHQQTGRMSGVGQQRTGHSDTGLLRGRQPRDCRFRIEVQAHRLQRGPGPPLRLAAVDGPEPGREAGPEGEIVGDRAVLDQPEILVHETSTELVGRVGQPEVEQPAAEEHQPARVRTVVAGQHLDQRGFARPVLAEQRMHLTSRDLQVDAVQGTVRREGLRQAGDVQRERRCWRSPEGDRRHLRASRACRGVQLRPQSLRYWAW